MRYRKRDYHGRGRKRKHIVVAAGIIIVFALSIVLGLMKACGIGGFGRAEQLSQEEIEERKPDIDVQLLTVNEYSRPGTEVEKIRGIVIHYTANPGSTAQNNRDYFEGLKDSHETSVSSHSLSDWKERLSSVFRRGRWHMRLIQEMSIQFPLNAVIPMKLVNLTGRHIVPL